MSPMGIAQQQAALSLVGGFVTGYVDKAAPVFARELHMGRPAYERFVAQTYPPVAYGQAEIPAAAAAIVGPVVAQAPKIRAKYERRTHFPGSGLPIAGAPWILLLGGVLLVATGAAGLVGPRAGVAAVPWVAIGPGIALAILAGLALLLTGRPPARRDA